MFYMIDPAERFYVIIFPYRYSAIKSLSMIAYGLDYVAVYQRHVASNNRSVIMSGICKTCKNACERIFKVVLIIQNPYAMRVVSF